MDVEFILFEADELSKLLPMFELIAPTIAREVLAQRLHEMIASGYRCVGIYHQQQLIGICGLWILVKYYVGRHLEPDNVFILPVYRGKGIGRQLNAWLSDYAKAHDCLAIELNCYVSNQLGKDFWEANHFVAIGLHYQKRLTQ